MSASGTGLRQKGHWSRLGFRRFGWALVPVAALWIQGCSLVTAPVETAVEVTGTIVSTAVKVVTAPVRRAADALGGDSDE